MINGVKKKERKLVFSRSENVQSKQVVYHILFSVTVRINKNNSVCTVS